MDVYYVHQREHAYLSFQEAEIGVADGGEEQLDAHLQPPRRRHLHVLHHQRLAGAPCHRSCTPAPRSAAHAHVHGRSRRPETKRAGRRMGREEEEAAGNTTFAFDGLSPGVVTVRQAAVAVGRHGAPSIGACRPSLVSPPLLLFFFLFRREEIEGALGSSVVASETGRPATWTVLYSQRGRGDGTTTKLLVFSPGPFVFSCGQKGRWGLQSPQRCA